MAMKPRRIVRAEAGLLVIDMQERLLPAMSGRESLLLNVRRLVCGGRILKLPLWVTEQYPKGLGHTVSELGEGLGEARILEKVTFSARGAESLLEEMKTQGVSDVIVCGIEAHVCVAQTCLDLMDAGKRVFVVADAVASRADSNCSLGIDRMRGAGAVPVSTEMILFELVETSGASEFRELQRLVK